MWVFGVSRGQPRQRSEVESANHGQKTAGAERVREMRSVTRVAELHRTIQDKNQEFADEHQGNA